MKLSFHLFPSCLAALGLALGLSGVLGAAEGARAEKFAAPQIKFTPRAFNKVESLPLWKECQASAVKDVPFNDGWEGTQVVAWKRYYPKDPMPEACLKVGGKSDKKFIKVTVPCDMFESENCQRGLRSKNTPAYQTFYKKVFPLKAEEISGKRLFLHFKCLAGMAKIFVNGKLAKEHVGHFTGFEADITPFVAAGDNVIGIELKADLGAKFAPELVKRAEHAYGNQWGPSSIKLGFVDEVRLLSTPEIRVSEMKISSQIAASTVTVDYVIDNFGKTPGEFTLDAGVFSAAEGSSAQYGKTVGQKITLAPGSNSGTLTVAVRDIKKWTPRDPNLNHLILQVKRGGNTVAADNARFGYKEFKIVDGEFTLNGENIYLFGDNHNSMDFIYTQKRNTAEKRDADIRAAIRRSIELGHNIVRTAHEPVCERYLEIADEMGLMVFQEWAWAFSQPIQYDKFGKYNTIELTEMVKAAHNHACVSMWSLGNEVWIQHNNLPVSNAQYDLVRKLDRQGRPISAQSGSAGYFNSFVCKTDLFDWHNYCGASYPWTEFPNELTKMIKTETDKYKEDIKGKPFIAWELVGFSWGGFDKDAKFRRGDVDTYAEYMKRQFNWGWPHAIGFAGSLPLFKVVKDDDIADFAQSMYGRRICEFIRIDGRLKGFAPWYSSCSGMTFWTQPVLPSLTQKKSIYPKNLFAGEKSEWDSAVVNNGGVEIAAGYAWKISFHGADAQGGALDRDWVYAQNEAVKNGEIKRGKITLQLPETARGHGEIRIILTDKEGKELGRNSYPVFVQSRKELTAPLAPARAVFVLDTGVAENVQATQAMLKTYGIAAKTVKTLGEAGKGALLVVPAEVAEQTLSAGDAEISGFIEKQDAVCLILEQHNLKSSLPMGQVVMGLTSPFIDMVSPEHPLFKGMDWSEFDTWNNNLGGAVAKNYCGPYEKNALAVKGPQLGTGGSKLGNAIIEASLGSGRLLVSFVETVSSYRTDSAAALYARNLLAYAGGKDGWGAALAYKKVAGAVNANAEYVMLDLRPFVNRSLSDNDKEGDNAGGWTDQGNNDLRTLKTGKTAVNGIPFTVLDKNAANGNAAVMLKGTQMAFLPEAVTVPVNAKCAAIHFNHTACFADKSKKAGLYRINYADGGKIDLVMAIGQNIDNWWGPRDLPQAKRGLVCANAKMGSTAGTYIFSWKNPSPNKEIKSIEIISAVKARGNNNEWETTVDAVPAVLAITVEKSGK